jgi:Tfp pilus assembly protein PilO
MSSREETDMANTLPLTKRALIDKANTRIVVYVSVAAFILVFSLVAAKTLVGQAAYQNRVIGAKRVAVNQLKTDISTTTQLKTAYDAFTNTTQNVIGGDPNGSGSQDGSNAKIVLDALPSTYDFPGLTTSLENLLTNQNGITINSISGTDNEASQGSNQLSPTPQPSPIPFTISVTGSYGSIQNVISTFERSIRPIQIQTLSLNGSGNSIMMTITAQTYYQPAKTFNIGKETVK